MNSSYTKVGLLWRLGLFGLGVGACSIAFTYGQWEWGILAALVVLVSGWSILHFVQSTHRRIRLFFDAVRYEDGSLHFREDQSNNQLKVIHQNMNRINLLIKEIRKREAQSERFLMEFMQRSMSGLIAVDQDDFVEIINDAALKLIGLNNLTHLNRLQQHNPALFELMSQLKPGQGQSLKILEDNTLRQVAVKMAMLNFSEKRYRIYSIYDIKSEMEENELETWQKLMRIMTHEIMNSIAPISSLSQTLSNYFTKDGEVLQLNELQQGDLDNTVKGLKVIEERAAGLQSFVDNYRKLSAIPQPEFVDIVLGDWLESIQMLFKGQQEEQQIHLSVSNDYDKASFPGDEKLLTHVVLNLLNNAAQALEGCESKAIELKAERGDSDSLRLSVIDNGKGFQAEERDKIFLPFYTTKQNGSGIGLSLSRQIIRMHKGSISASSEPGLRTKFVIQI